MEQVGEDGGSSMLSYIEFLTYLFIKNKRILSSVMMIYNELRRSDGFILRRSSLYFPEKGCHLGTNRSDNET